MGEVSREKVVKSIEHRLAELNQSLFVPGGRIAEHCFKAVMCSQCGIADLFPGMSAEAIFVPCII